jgi:hypothetical protein
MCADVAAGGSGVGAGGCRSGDRIVVVVVAALFVAPLPADPAALGATVVPDRRCCCQSAARCKSGCGGGNVAAICLRAAMTSEQLGRALGEGDQHDSIRLASSGGHTYGTQARSSSSSNRKSCRTRTCTVSTLKWYNTRCCSACWR